MLGRDLAAALRDKFDLAGVGLGSGNDLGIPYKELDLADTNQVQAYWDHEKPDLVFHLAAMTDVDACELEANRDTVYRNNTHVVDVVAQASKKHQAPIVFISTDFVFDGRDRREYAENDEVNPLSVYGKSKADAEKILRDGGGMFVIFRICWLYGLHGRSFPRAILQASKNKSCLKVVQDQIGRPTFTRDVCGAFSMMLDRDEECFRKKSGNIFHLANTGKASWADFAEEVLQAAQIKNCKVERISCSELDPPRLAKRPEHAVLSLDKLKKEFGVELRTWQEAVNEFIPELNKQLS